MKGIWAVWIVFAALLVFPTAAQADRPECPFLLTHPGGSIVATARCASELQQPSASSRTAGSRMFLPIILPASAGPTPADPTAVYHIVQPAESLAKIADRYDTTIDALALTNPQITNPGLIHVNDKLRIPTPEETERLSKEAAYRRLVEQRQVVSSVPHHGERWVDVDLSTQTVRAYEGDTLMRTFLASTGIARYPTVTGRFHIWLKLNSDDMKGPGYDLEDVPYVMYFHKDYALHGTYWHSSFGTPMSHGCVNLRTSDAAWLFDFTRTGTLVNVH